MPTEVAIVDLVTFWLGCVYIMIFNISDNTLVVSTVMCGICVP